MRTALRIVALFAVYSGLAFVGDYAVGLLADEADPAPVTVSQELDDEREVVVDVRSEIVSRVQVRRTDRCDYALDRELTVPASGVRLVDVEAGAGELRVEGRGALEEIVVVGRVCASDEALLDELTVTVQADDGVIRLETHYPERDGWSGRSTTASIDLVVLVPAGMAVDVDDSSGGIEVRGTGDLRIDDSSGGISVADIDGSVEIDDSSGGLEVRGVRGDARIDDSSGGIDVRSVEGSVELRDSSGGIEIANVGADVVIESDGSGGIDVSDVGGGFVVRRDGSGSIRHSGVQGTVDIPADKRRDR